MKKQRQASTTIFTQTNCKVTERDTEDYYDDKLGKMRRKIKWTQECDLHEKSVPSTPLTRAILEKMISESMKDFVREKTGK